MDDDLGLSRDPAGSGSHSQPHAAGITFGQPSQLATQATTSHGITHGLPVFPSQTYHAPSPFPPFAARRLSSHYRSTGVAGEVPVQYLIPADPDQEFYAAAACGVESGQRGLAESPWRMTQAGEAYTPEAESRQARIESKLEQLGEDLRRLANQSTPAQNRHSTVEQLQARVSALEAELLRSRAGNQPNPTEQNPNETTDDSDVPLVRRKRPLVQQRGKEVVCTKRVKTAQEVAVGDEHNGFSNARARSVTSTRTTRGPVHRGQRFATSANPGSLPPEETRSGSSRQLSFRRRPLGQSTPPVRGPLEPPAVAIDHAAVTTASEGSRQLPSLREPQEQIIVSQGPVEPAKLDNGAATTTRDAVLGEQLPMQFLAFLRRMNCNSDDDLLRLKQYVNGIVAFELPICADTDRSYSRGKYSYVLKVGGRLGQPLCTNPGNRPKQQIADQETAENLNVFECYLDEKRAAITHDGPPLRHPPSYLVPLGEVYRVCLSSLKCPQVASTNFFVMMEVDTPRKSVWFMFRYEKLLDQRDGGRQWKPVPRDSTVLVPGQPENRLADTVPLLDNITRWVDPTREMLSIEEFKASLGVNFSLKPVFYTPVLTSLREALKKGWERAGQEVAE